MSVGPSSLGSLIGGDAHQPDTEVTGNDTTWLPTQVTVLPSFTGWIPPGDTLPFFFSMSKLLSADLGIDTVKQAEMFAAIREARAKAART